MKRNTRQEILCMARSLFNEKGFNCVSLRDIANALKISEGNLTYHFSKKEDIVEALLEENQDTKPANAPATLEELDAYFLDMQQTVQNNSYYFLHHAQLSQISASIRDKQNARYAGNRSMLTEAFATFHAVGLFRAEGFWGEYDRVIDTLHISCIYWKSFSVLRQSQVTYRYHAWSMVHNLLTEKGKTELNRIMSL